jgi:hypothetical protein
MLLMSIPRDFIVLVFLVVSLSLPAYANNQNIFFHEHFNDLNNWKALHFPKIKKHTLYAIQTDGEISYLKAASNASASALICKKTFNVYEYPIVKWRWKVENVYDKGNAKTKKGDDYPLRIYIIFEYNPKEARFFEKLKYKSAKLLYGEYPPHSSLNYIWANKEHTETVIISSYTNKSRIIPLQSGVSNIATWQTEKINILEDYKKAFGTKPPAFASLAIMNDSDNTGESSVSYLDDIKVLRENSENDSKL